MKGRLALLWLATATIAVAQDGPVARVSSGAGFERVTQGATAWQTQAAGAQWLTLDFGAPRDLGGLVIDWLPGEAATDYEVELGDDGKAWRRAIAVAHGNGGTDWLRLGEVKTRWLRLSLRAGEGDRYGLRRLDLRQPAFGAPNAVFEAIALREGASQFPRGFSAQQTYWTVAGVDGGADNGLLSEDGTLETGRGGFSMQPFVLDATGCEPERPQLSGWQDVVLSQSLPDGYLPMPQVQWRRTASGCDGAGAFALDIEAFGAGARGAARLVATYVLRNDGPAARTFTLALAALPFQVNPPLQGLATPGGVSALHKLSMANERVTVDGRPRVYALEPPGEAFATTFDAGMAPAWLARGGVAPASSVRDDAGFASGAWLYPMTLGPGESRSIALDVPLAGAGPADLHGASVRRLRGEVAAGWHVALDGVTLRMPASQRALADTLRTALAHVLINRSGVQVRAGARALAGATIDDGARISAALLRVGRSDAAIDFLQWYAGFVAADGAVPCCVDARGADPQGGGAAQGAFLFLAAECVRYTANLDLARSVWPGVESAARHLEALRAGPGPTPPAATPADDGEPASASASYDDDAWALIGFKSALSLAQILGRANEARWLAASCDRVRASLLASAADPGRVDAAALALAPADELPRPPQAPVLAAFEHHWAEFVARRDGTREWQDYSPREWRHVAALVRLGWRARAHEAIAFFMQHRRPAAWNQWAGVAGRDERQPRAIGDMPHGGVAADFIGSVLDLFAYERAGERALVLAAGVLPAWLEGEGTGIAGLRTPFGTLDYTLRRDGERVFLRVGEGIRVPSGGLVLAWPLERAPVVPKKLARSLEWRDGELVIRAAPLEVELKLVR
jgi:hypothetical protein